MGHCIIIHYNLEYKYQIYRYASIVCASLCTMNDMHHVIVLILFFEIHIFCLDWPYNSREINRKATLIIGMSGKTTEIKDPENLSADPKKFAFDYSYWSHDGFTEQGDGYLQPGSTKYADQVCILRSLLCVCLLSHCSHSLLLFSSHTLVTVITSSSLHVLFCFWSYIVYVV